MSNPSAPHPLVACICITANRPEFTARAVECYRAQDYPDRRLLIFDTSVTRSATMYQSADIIHWYEDRRPGDTVGTLRNRANSFADLIWHPELLAHWDSDDESAPNRLTDQVSRLAGASLAMTGYRSMVFTDGKKRWRYNGDPQFALGTSLVYRMDWWRAHKFVSRNVGEDNEAVSEAWNARQLVTAHGGDLMTAWMHPGNTSPKVPGANWEEIS